MSATRSHTGYAGNWWLAVLVVNTWAEEVGVQSKNTDIRRYAGRLLDQTATIVNERIIAQRLEVLFSRNKVEEADLLYDNIRQTYYQIIARFPAIYDRVVAALDDSSVDGYLADRR